MALPFHHDVAETTHIDASRKFIEMRKGVDRALSHDFMKVTMGQFKPQVNLRYKQSDLACDIRYNQSKCNTKTSVDSSNGVSIAFGDSTVAAMHKSGQHVVKMKAATNGSTSAAYAHEFDKTMVAGRVDRNANGDFSAAFLFGHYGPKRKLHAGLSTDKVVFISTEHRYGMRESITTSSSTSLDLDNASLTATSAVDMNYKLYSQHADNWTPYATFIKTYTTEAGSRAQIEAGLRAHMGQFGIRCEVDHRGDAKCGLSIAVHPIF